MLQWCGSRYSDAALRVPYGSTSVLSLERAVCQRTDSPMVADRVSGKIRSAVPFATRLKSEADCKQHVRCGCSVEMPCLRDTCLKPWECIALVIMEV